MISSVRPGLCVALSLLAIATHLLGRPCLGLSSAAPPAGAYTEAFYSVHAWSASPFRADGSLRSGPGPVYQFNDADYYKVDRFLGTPGAADVISRSASPTGPLFGLNTNAPLWFWPTADGVLIAAANPCRDQTQLCPSAMRLDTADTSNSTTGRPRLTSPSPPVPALPSIVLWHEPLNPASGHIGVVMHGPHCPMVTFKNLARTSDQDQLWHSELVPGRLTGQVELCGNGTVRLRYLSVPPQPGDVLPETVSHEPYANASSAPRLIAHDAGAGQAPFVGLAGPLNLTVTLPPPRWRGGRLTATAFEVTPSALQQPIKRLPSGRVVETIPPPYADSGSCWQCHADGGVWCTGAFVYGPLASKRQVGRCMHPTEAKVFCTQVGALAVDCDASVQQRLRDLRQPYAVTWHNTRDTNFFDCRGTTKFSFAAATITVDGETCAVEPLVVRCPSRTFNFLTRAPRSAANSDLAASPKYPHSVTVDPALAMTTVTWIPMGPSSNDTFMSPDLDLPVVTASFSPHSITVDYQQCDLTYAGSYAIPPSIIGCDGGGAHRNLDVALGRSVVPLPVELILTPVSPCPVCHHGTCGGNQTRCVCPMGYAGASCERCSSGYFESGGSCVKCPACVNGTCSSTGTCDCSAGFGGPLCDVKCPPCPACDQRHGSCVCGVCKCADGWGGALCDAAPSGSPAFASSTMYIVVGSVGAAAAVAGAIVVLLCCCRRAAPAVKEPTQEEMREAFTSAVSLVDDAASDAPSSVGALPTDGGPGHELLEPSTPSAPPSSPAKIRLPVRGGRRRARPSFVTFKDSRMSSSASFDIL